jgi:hypothetical protein
MKFLFGLLVTLSTLMLGCGSKHELILYNRSGKDLRPLGVMLDENRLQVGGLSNDRVRRVSWRGKTHESGYEFWEGEGAEAKPIGSCGYASNPMPGSVIAYLIVFEPDGSVYCRRIAPE